MSQTIRSHYVSLPRAKIFKHTFTPSADTTVRLKKIHVFEAHRKGMEPAGGSIDELISEWSEDAAFAEQISQARRRFARAEHGGVQTIKSVRLALGLSQMDVAKCLKTSQSHIARIENGNACPTIETGKKLAAVLKVDMNTLTKLLPNANEEIEACP